MMTPEKMDEIAEAMPEALVTNFDSAFDRVIEYLMNAAYGAGYDEGYTAATLVYNGQPSSEMADSNSSHKRGHDIHVAIPTDEMVDKKALAAATMISQRKHISPLTGEMVDKAVPGLIQ